MSGWIQAAMQQNTNFAPHAVYQNDSHTATPTALFGLGFDLRTPKFYGIDYMDLLFIFLILNALHNICSNICWTSQEKEHQLGFLAEVEQFLSTFSNVIRGWNPFNG